MRRFESAALIALSSSHRRLRLRPGQLARHIPKLFRRPDRPLAKGWAVSGEVFLGRRSSCASRRDSPWPVAYAKVTGGGARF